jgi:hypothetical protein
MAILNDVLRDPDPDGQGQGSGGSQDDTPSIIDAHMVEEAITEDDNERTKQ